MEILQVLFPSLVSEESAALTSLESSDRQGGFGGFTGPLSSFYQLNMGLIGIGALAVVAIIGSRNFFPNYLFQHHSNQNYDYPYPSYDQNYHRRTWDDWHDYWYGNRQYEDPYSDPDGIYGGGGHDTRRYRRSASDDVKTEEFLLKSIKDLDRDECGFRLVCELGSLQRLTSVEKEVLKLIRFGDKKYNYLYPGKGLLHNNKELKEYKRALEKGKKAEDCEKLYSSCSYSAKELMSAVGKIKHIL